LAYRRSEAGLEVLLVHPGGPFWRNKDDGAWSIPKGEIGATEDLEQRLAASSPKSSVRLPQSASWKPWGRSASVAASA
jgi:predicted NUDIX family NTP pyrophosphohydrolase